MIQFRFNAIDELIELINFITGRSEETKTLKKIIADLNSSAEKLSTSIRETKDAKSGS